MTLKEISQHEWVKVMKRSYIQILPVFLQSSRKEIHKVKLPVTEHIFMNLVQNVEKRVPS